MLFLCLLQARSIKRDKVREFLMFGQEDVFKILAVARLLHSARKGDSSEAAGIPPIISTQPNQFFVGQNNLSGYPKC